MSMIATVASGSYRRCGEAAQRLSMSRRTAVLVPAILLCLTRASLGIEDERLELFDPRPSVERLAQMWQEIDRGREQMRQNGQAKAADELLERANELKDAYQVKRKLPPSEKAELHAVGVYSGRFDRGPKRPGVVNVKVTYKAAPIILSLSAYEFVQWQIEIDPGVRLKEIYVSGYHRHEVKVNAAEAKTTNRSGNGGDITFCYRRDGDYVALVTMLKRQLGLQPITFQGDYIPGDQPFVVGPESDRWCAEALAAALRPIYNQATKATRDQTITKLSKLRFEARFGQRYGDFTLLGPVQATLRPFPKQLDPLGVGLTKVAYDPDGKQYYAISAHGLVRFDFDTGKDEVLEPDQTLPEFSIPCALAFDTKRHRLVIATLGGEGYLYAYDPARTKWSLISSMCNVDASSLAYSAWDDMLYATLDEHDGHGEMVRAMNQMDARGSVVKKIRFSRPIQAEVHITSLQAICVDAERLVLLAVPPEPAWLAETSAVHCYVVNQHSGEIEFACVQELQK